MFSFQWCETQEFQCYLCNEALASFDVMIKHMDSHYGVTDIVGKEDKKEADANDDQPNEGGSSKKVRNGNYYCCCCPANFNLRRMLKIHIWRHYFDQDVLKQFIKQSTAR